MLDALPGSTLLEAGVGEATTLCEVLRCSGKSWSCAAGFDLAWSRIAVARSHVASLDSPPELFTGNFSRSRCVRRRSILCLPHTPSSRIIGAKPKLCANWRGSPAIGSSFANLPTNSECCDTYAHRGTRILSRTARSRHSGGIEDCRSPAPGHQLVRKQRDQVTCPGETPPPVPRQTFLRVRFADTPSSPCAGICFVPTASRPTPCSTVIHACFPRTKSWPANSQTLNFSHDCPCVGGTS